MVTHNFRPGVMEKVGLDYTTLKTINPKLVYAEITGYGKEGPWKNKPGQDLLLQSLSGLVYTSGNKADNPVPFGIAIADILSGAHLVQGILAALVRRQKKGVGALIEVSLLESLLDFQFELLTTYYTSRQVPQRSKISNGHTLLSAPYGIYQAKEGFIAIAMVPLAKLAAALDCPALQAFSQEEAFGRRDEIKNVLSVFLAKQPTGYWLSRLQRHDIWAMPVLNWQELIDHPAYKALGMEQELTVTGRPVTTTRCPIRINGERLFSDKAAPALGEHTGKIKAELLNQLQ